MSTNFLGFLLFVWYVVGLAAMVKNGFFWWVMIGAIMPPVPMVYVVVKLLEHWQLF